MFIDLAFALFAALGFYWGYSRGIIRTVLSVVAVFVGFVLAVRFSPYVTDALSSLFSTAPTGAMPLIGFIVAFVLVLVSLRLLAVAAERALTAVRLNGINKFAGGLASAIATTLLFSLIMTFVDAANLLPLKQKAESITYGALAAFPEQAYGLLGKAQPALEEVRAAGEKAMKR